MKHSTDGGTDSAFGVMQNDNVDSWIRFCLHILSLLLYLFLCTLLGWQKLV
jgi:hypothetical protein